MPVGQPEFPEFADNPEPRCPVVLLLDASGSMSGEPINELNQGINAFWQSVKQDSLATLRVEVAVVKFGPVRLVQDFGTIVQTKPPKLEAESDTPLGAAIEYALDLLDTRKKTYKASSIQYYRPWIFLVTDGAPTDSWENAANRVRQAENDRKHLFFAVGVEGADMDTLTQIAPKTRPPLMLKGLDFKPMFEWLSASMKRVSASRVGTEEQISLPPVGWGEVQT
jgi:uncharacterized protein YegL